MTPDLARLAAGILLVPEDASEPVAFAAEELAAYLGRMFGASPERRTQAGSGSEWLALAPDARPLPPVAVPAGCEYAVRPVDDRLVVTGATPRAVLAGVYALLQAAGCRWSPHGAAEEHVPGPGEARRTLPTMEGRPSFARRAYAADLAGWHYTMPDRLADRLPRDRAFIDWMAKSGATGFLFIRHANDSQWVIPELVPELRRRGLEVEGGGHALVELLPRALFAAHPEYFPVGADGRRSDLGNLCVSSGEALAIVRERARAARADIPGATGLHLWGLDLLGGGWCRCAGCAGRSASEQLLLACNEAADTVAEGGRIFHLAYHDTIEPPRRVTPDPRVWAEFAPRERCYGHALDDPACATNVPYRVALEEHVERFGGRVEVFEYYGDAILFGGCAVPLTGVIGRDLEYYQRAGVRGVSCLVFGDYSLWAYGVNVDAFARAALRPAAAAAALEAHAARRFGPAAGPMARYLTALEAVMGGVVTYGDVLLPPRDAERAAPLRARLAAALGREPTLRRLIGEAAAAGGSPAVIAAEQRLLDYTLAVLGAVRGWLDGHLDAAPGADVAERAVAALSAAIRHVREVETSIAGTWGAHDLEVTHHFFAAALRARGA
jgi:hypothetical protein